MALLFSLASVILRTSFRASSAVSAVPTSVSGPLRLPM